MSETNETNLAVMLGALAIHLPERSLARMHALQAAELQAASEGRDFAAVMREAEEVKFIGTHTVQSQGSMFAEGMTREEIQDALARLF